MAAKKPKKKGKVKFKKLELSVVGIQYRVTKPTRRMMRHHVPFKVKLEREPENLHDENAIKVIVAKHFDNPYAGMHMGYLRSKVAAVWAGPIDRGELQFGDVWVTSIDTEDGIAEMTVEVAGDKQTLMVGP